MAVQQPVLVLGGGINGAAVARELILNQVPVCLVDQADISFGATAASSRLIHGGLRYLEYGELDLVRQALRERSRLLRLAPQFVHPLQLFIPLRNRWGGLLQAPARFLGWQTAGPRRPRGLRLVRLGLRLYDLLVRDRSLPRHALWRPGQPGTPAVDGRAFGWLCAYHDAQVTFPERLVVALLEDAQRLAQQHDVRFDVFTYHRACLDHGRVEIRPEERPEEGTGSEAAGENNLPPVVCFRPSAIVNATGAWLDHTLAGLGVASARLIGGTKGSHLLTFQPLLRDVLAGQGVYAEADDGRPIFLLPFGEATLVGTTDLPFEGPPQQAVAEDHELDYLVAAVNQVFPQVHLTRDDIDLHYCGVRPLAYRGDHRQTSAITRRFLIVENDQAGVPLLSLVGGKLTTCRLLAERVVARLLPRLGMPVQRNSRQRVVPGGEHWPADRSSLLAEQQELARSGDWQLEQVQAVWRLCGRRARAMLGPPDDRAEDRAGDRQNLEGTCLPLGFVRRVIRQQWVSRLSDLVERRLMLLYDQELSEPCLRQLAGLLVEQGKLAAGEVEGEVEACRRRLQTHFGKRIQQVGGVR